MKFKKFWFKKVIGLDFALNGFYVDTTGKKANYPMYYINSLEKPAKAQRKLSKRVKTSNNYYKQKLVVAKIHEKIKNQRTDFLHQESRRLVNDFDIICVESLNVT